jgi:hypothetical protein
MARRDSALAPTATWGSRYRNAPVVSVVGALSVYSRLQAFVLLQENE